MIIRGKLSFILNGKCINLNIKDLSMRSIMAAITAAERKLLKVTTLRVLH